MVKLMPLQWESIELINQLTPQPPNLGILTKTDRAKVLGGWLVRTILIKRDIVQANPTAPQQLESDTSVALTFVPDPQFAWTK